MRRSLKAVAIAVLVVLGCSDIEAQAAETIRLANGEWHSFLSKGAPHHGFASHIVTDAFALVGVEVEYGFFPWSRPPQGSSPRSARRPCGAPLTGPVDE